MQKASMAGSTIPTEGGKGKQSGQLTRPERPSTRRAERETRARSSNSRFVPIRSRSKKGDSEQFLGSAIAHCRIFFILLSRQGLLGGSAAVARSACPRLCMRQTSPAGEGPARPVEAAVQNHLLTARS